MKKRMLCLILTLVAVLGVCLVGCAQEESFVPPAFDAAAVAGDHGVAEGERGYSVLPPPESNSQYRVGLCGEIHVKEGKADIWFTNPAENSAWLKLRVLNEEGEIIGETGLVKQGEYVQSITFYQAPLQGEKITLRVMGYAPESYYSKGEISLNTVVSSSDAVKEGISVLGALLIVICVAFVGVAIVFVVLLTKKPAPVVKKNKKKH